MVYPHGAVFSLFTVFVEESDSLGFYIISVLRLGARSRDVNKPRNEEAEWRQTTAQSSWKQTSAKIE